MAEHEENKEKTVTIVVDGTPYEVPKKENIGYAEVVTLAYPDYPQHPEMTYSVTYTRGQGNKPEGILPPGGTVKVKEGMSFSVNRTGQS
jgi:multiubiquitin